MTLNLVFMSVVRLRRTGSKEAASIISILRYLISYWCTWSRSHSVLVRWPASTSTHCSTTSDECTAIGSSLSTLSLSEHRIVCGFYSPSSGWLGILPYIMTCLDCLSVIACTLCSTCIIGWACVGRGIRNSSILLRNCTCICYFSINLVSPLFSVEHRARAEIGDFDDFEWNKYDLLLFLMVIHGIIVN